MFPLWFTLLGGSFVFLDVGPSILFLVFIFFGVLWFIYDWQGFIIYLHGLQQGNVTMSTKERKWAQLLNITFEQNSTHQNLVVVWQKVLTCHENSKKIMDVLQFIAL